ncbi:periplasmic heavy metal sensor [Bosea sp. (in: a-proteobacteria)]|uniref:periplasmic heavy metal sensor n=1 Tax=Bosea sp. (in: a-proteobacteria) TaxID=1871050 RepID=UPI002B49340F|nr:Spy/CpxP family protein refolding chaperone [Bosea sp. (in: a-proteobacteria)]WRH56130.1 MAG: periplasmic heavy metal sensor [Bosea sp. (in: a-proteobacteria)]
MTRIAMTSAFVLASVSLWPAELVWAQTASPYAGEQKRVIKALSIKDVDDLMQGRGMGLAKVAELNRYPGPMHGLELAEPIKLSREQQDALTAIMARMSSEAKALGAAIVDLERELDAAFAARTIDHRRMQELTELIGVKQGAIRSVHLAAHLETAAALSSEQIAQYDVLRGYSGIGAAPVPEPVHGGHGKSKH